MKRTVILSAIILMSHVSAFSYSKLGINGMGGAQYSFKEDIEKSHNNPFIPSFLLGLEYNFTERFRASAYGSFLYKKGYPIIYSYEFENNQVAETSKRVDKTGESIIRKTYVNIGIAYSIVSIEKLYVNATLEICTGKYFGTSTSSVGKSTSEALMFGPIPGLSLEKYFANSVFLKFKIGYMHNLFGADMQSLNQNGINAHLGIGVNIFESK